VVRFVLFNEIGFVEGLISCPITEPRKPGYSLGLRPGVVKVMVFPLISVVLLGDNDLAEYAAVVHIRTGD
jgi:hypothetical protein